MPKLHRPKTHKKHLIKQPSRPGLLSVIAILTVVVAIAGYLVVHFSHAATQSNIPAEAAVGGVPIPSQGLYLGGIEKDQQPGATVPGCTTTAWPEMECKITWAAQQLGIASGHLQSDGQYHSALDHYFYTGCGASAGNDFKPGGRLYVAAHTPGRQVLLIDMKCGNDWSTLAHSGGTASQDAQLKTFATQLDNVGLPVILSIYNEPENDICGNAYIAKNNNMGTPDDFRAMYRQAAADVRSVHPKNISLALTLQGYTLSQDAKQNNDEAVFTGCGQADILKADRNPNNYYPGDDVVDFLTFQEYDHDKGDFASSYQVYQDWMNKACPTNHPSTNYTCTSAVRSKKWMGTSEFGISGSKDFRVKYFTDMITQIKQFPQIKYLSYWSSQDDPKFPDFIDYPYQTADSLYRNADGTWAHADYGTDQTHASLKAFTQFALSDYVFKPVFGQATPTPTTVPTPTPTPGGDTVKPTVSITRPAAGPISGVTEIDITSSDNVGVDHVILAIDGKNFATRTTASSVVNWNTANTTNGSHTLVATAYDAAGNAGVSAAITVNVSGGNGGPVTVEGDVNNDGQVNITDLSALISHWEQNYPAADFNGDGLVNITDLSILLTHWNG